MVMVFPQFGQAIANAVDNMAVTKRSNNSAATNFFIFFTSPFFFCFPLKSCFYYIVNIMHSKRLAKKAFILTQIIRKEIKLYHPWHY